ncbi:hypothetical protein GCM10011404_32530 [Sphingomonas prati]|uniref:SMI1/KNR4 family protein n=1 Tax=Sphingomonas prati TaxID=1843237 RepID=A0A7W9F4T7_9SPHN|nr:hypothetical protein [Sphingomonas prati]GGE96860.1 hypothetical protein GCM10011404_32530 [Sphingomonas prati]
MDLKSINPYVYAMWDEYRTLGSYYYEETSPETLASIEAEVGAKLPGDYKEFALKSPASMQSQGRVRICSTASFRAEP